VGDKTRMKHVWHFRVGEWEVLIGLLTHRKMKWSERWGCVRSLSRRGFCSNLGLIALDIFRWGGAQ
jgi:hypothetical protein